MKDKLKGFFGTSDEAVETATGEDGYYTTSREEFHEQKEMTLKR